MRPSAKSLRQRRGQGGQEDDPHQPGLRTPSESREADVEAEGSPSPGGGAAEAQSEILRGGVRWGGAGPDLGRGQGGRRWAPQPAPGLVG